MNNTAWWIIIFILILLILAAGEIYRETHTFRGRKYKVKTKKSGGVRIFSQRPDDIRGLSGINPAEQIRTGFQLLLIAGKIIKQTVGDHPR